MNPLTLLSVSYAIVVVLSILVFWAVGAGSKRVKYPLVNAVVMGIALPRVIYTKVVDR